VLGALKRRLLAREHLPREVRRILREQEIVGERTVAYVRAGFAVFTFVAMWFSLQGQSRTANVIYGVDAGIWLIYSGVAFLLLRQQRVYSWLKYLSITVDISVLFLGMVGNLYNHSGPYEVFRNPAVWIVVAGFNVMAALRYSVRASLYSAVLTLLYGTALCAYVYLRVQVKWTDDSIWVGEGLSVREDINSLLFVAATAVFGAVIAANSRRLIVQAARDSLARMAIEQERDRLKKYFSKDVVDLVLQDPQSMGLGGRRMHATVLFSDIRNFTRLSEQLEPEQVVDVLNRYFSTMVDIVFRHGGTLDKFIGDGLMALFGVPYPMDSSEERAVRAALDMVAALDEFNRELQVRGLARIEIGVGINTGPVVAGNIGSDLRHEYTVIGDTVNLAARLEGLNKGEKAQTQILVSEPVYRAIKDRYPARSLGMLAVRGKALPIEVFSIATDNAEASKASQPRAV